MTKTPATKRSRKKPPPPEQTKTDALLGDFRNFVYLLWRHLRLPDPTPVQYDIAHYLQHGPRRLMVKGFRGVGKSWLTSAFVLWSLLRNPNERVLVVSGSKARADAFSIFTRRLIDEVPLLHGLKPKPAQRDSVVEFDVGPSAPHQAASVRAVGITGQMTGSRSTLIVADDVETPKNSLTETMRERLAELVKEFDAVVTDMTCPDGSVLPGRVVFLGTDQTENSLYKRLPERGYEVRVWPARVPEPAKVLAYGGTLAPFVESSKKKAGAPLDPTRFSEEDLLQREASYGRAGFALQFMLDPALSDEDRYPLRCRDFIVMDLDPVIAPQRVAWGSGHAQIEQNLTCFGLDGDRWHQPMYVSDEWFPLNHKVMYVDPAGRGSDEVGYAIVGELAGKLYVLDVGGMRGGYSTENLEALCRLAQQFQVHRMLVEPNFGDGMFRQLLAPLIGRFHSVSLEDATWSKGQKERRIIDTLEPLLMQHRLVLNRAVVLKDTKVEEREYKLGYQLTRVTRDRGAIAHDDRLEALAGACKVHLDVMNQDEELAALRLESERMDKELSDFLARFEKNNPMAQTEPRWGRERNIH